MRPRPEAAEQAQQVARARATQPSVGAVRRPGACAGTIAEPRPFRMRPRPEAAEQAQQVARARATQPSVGAVRRPGAC
ncbi:hypothetical protein CTI14_07955, partial [Methylobacterium radiotolerans]